MRTSTLKEKKQRLAEAELDLELDRLRTAKANLRRRFKYGGTYRVRSPQSISGSGHHRRGCSSAEALRGLGGPELQALVRDLLAFGKVGCNHEAACEYRNLTGKELPYGYGRIQETW